VGARNLRVGVTEGLNYLDYLHQEMRERMGEVHPQKNFQHHAVSHLAAQARSQGCAFFSETAGRQAGIAEVERTGVVGSNSGHS